MVRQYGTSGFMAVKVGCADASYTVVLMNIWRVTSQELCQNKLETPVEGDCPKLYMTVVLINSSHKMT